MECARLARLFALRFCFFLRFGLAIFIKLDKTIRFVVLLLFFYLFFANFVSSFLLHLWPWVVIFVCPGFAFFFCLPVCFLVFPLVLYPYRTARLFLPLHSSEWSSLTTMTIPTHFLFFSLCACIEKYVFLAHLLLVLPYFCFPPCPWVHPHPSACIITPIHPPAQLYACTTWIWLFGEISRP